MKRYQLYTLKNCYSEVNTVSSRKPHINVDLCSLIAKVHCRSWVVITQVFFLVSFVQRCSTHRKTPFVFNDRINVKELAMKRKVPNKKGAYDYSL